MSTEVVVAIEPPGATIDIVLISGWHKDRRPWRDLSPGKLGEEWSWPKKFFPKLIPEARILMVEYDPRLEDFWAVKAENEIDIISEDVIWGLQALREDDAVAKRPIIFIAHSLGGLIFANVLLRASKGSPVEKLLAKCVKAVVFLGTSFRGNDLKLWAETASKFHFMINSPSSSFLEDLEKKSRTLADIGKDFPLLLEYRNATPDETGLEVACFYEGIETHQLVQGAGKQMIIVEEEEVRLPGANNTYKLHATHLGMCDFDGEKDLNFKRFSRVVLRWAKQWGKVEEEKTEQPGSMIANISGRNEGVQVGFNPGTISGFTFHRSQSPHTKSGSSS